MDNAKQVIRRRLAEVKTFLAQESRPRLSEADTKANFIEPIIAALGWEGIGVVTREYYVRNSQEFIDYVLAGATGPLLAIEAKPLQMDLTDKHAAQLVQYCAVDGIEWAALTNGRELQFFNTFLKPDLAAKRVLRLDMLAFNSDAEFEAMFGQIWQLSRESMTTPSGVRTWLHQRRLDAALRGLLFDPTSSATRYLRKTLADSDITATPQDVAQWFRTHLGATMPSIGPASTGIGDTGPSTGPVESETRKLPSLAPIATSVQSKATSGERYILTSLSARETHSVREVLQELLGSGWYAFGDRTPTRRALAEGDCICFYESGVGIVAEAEVAGAPERLTPPVALDLERFPWAFRVRNVRFFLDAPVAIDAGLRSRLDAFGQRDPHRPWAWFVQGTHTVTPHDFAVLTGRDPDQLREAAGA